MNNLKSDRLNNVINSNGNLSFFNTDINTNLSVSFATFIKLKYYEWGF